MSDKNCCSNCRHQMTGFDGGFFGLPFTCECRIYGETENRKDCRHFQKKVTKEDMIKKISELKKENEQLRKERILLEYQLKVQDRIIEEYEGG